MRKLYAGITLLLMIGSAAIASERAKNVYKTTHLSTTQVGISCQNGADPTGRKIGDLLIISCGDASATQ